MNCTCGERLFSIYVRQGVEKRGLCKMGVACAKGHSALLPGRASVCGRCGYIMREIISNKTGKRSLLCGECDTLYKGKRRRLLKRNLNKTEPWGWLEPDGKVTVGM